MRKKHAHLSISFNFSLFPASFFIRLDRKTMNIAPRICCFTFTIVLSSVGKQPGPKICRQGQPKIKE